MIDLIQWRVTIGCFYTARRYHGKSVGNVSWKWISVYFMMSVTVIAVIQMLILLCCDVETNPGPTLGSIHVSLTNVNMSVSIVLTAANAVTVLTKSGFIVKEQWSDLARHLGVPLSEREKLIETAARTQDYLIVLEKVLEWWISNHEASWEILISSVTECSGSCDSADNMRKFIGTFENYNM